MAIRFRSALRGLVPLSLAAAVLWPVSAHALFDDDEARKAIIELRQRVEANRLAAEAANRQATEAANSASAKAVEEVRESNATMRRSLLDLANQIEQLRAETARLRGQNEQLAREVSELQRQQKDVQLGLDERLRKVEPVRVSLDGKEFSAEPGEKRDFETALEMLRRSEFEPSAQSFVAFLKRYPQSGYTASALYWLGNAQYANRAYKEAIDTHRRLVVQFPAHPRAPEAMLALANSQVELKDTKAARRTLDDLVKAHPQSEAAVAARERLTRLR